MPYGSLISTYGPPIRWIWQVETIHIKTNPSTRKLMKPILPVKYLFYYYRISSYELDNELNC